MPAGFSENMNGNSAMRETEASFWMVQNAALTRALRLAAIALGVGLVMAAGPVRAGDDEDEDDKTFEEKIIEGIMRGLGGTNMENRGIVYRGRRHQSSRRREMSLTIRHTYPETGCIPCSAIPSARCRTRSSTTASGSRAEAGSGIPVSAHP